jgi:hypothetical protein
VIEHAGKQWLVERCYISAGLSDDVGAVLPVEYMLRESSGVKGEQYGVLRSTANPKHLYAVNTRRIAARTPFDGFAFEEHDGCLVVVS